MIKKFNFLVYPLLTVIFLVIAWVSGGDDFQTARNGTPTEGTVNALVRCYEDKCDLILDVVQELTLTQADGEIITATTDRNGIRDAESYTETQIEAINTVKGGKADGVQRFLLRENDKQSDDRIIKVERIERATILADLPDFPSQFTVAEDGLLESVTAGSMMLNADSADELFTRIVFTYIGGTEEAAELKRDVREESSRMFNGKPVEHDSKDFILYETDFRFVFRPIYTYETETGPQAALADIGARMTPRGGHHIGNKMLIAYLPDEPGKATILSDFSQLDWKADPIQALNRLFEITFGRWFFPAVCLVVAIVYFFMSIISVPLMLKPPKTENADTVDEDMLAKMN